MPGEEVLVGWYTVWSTMLIRFGRGCPSRIYGSQLEIYIWNTYRKCCECSWTHALEWRKSWEYCKACSAHPAWVDPLLRLQVWHFLASYRFRRLLRKIVTQKKRLQETSKGKRTERIFGSTKPAMEICAESVCLFSKGFRLGTYMDGSSYSHPTIFYHPWLLCLDEQKFPSRGIYDNPPRWLCRMLVTLKPQVSRLDSCHYWCPIKLTKPKAARPDEYLSQSWVLGSDSKPRISAWVDWDIRIPSVHPGRSEMRAW